MSRPLVSLILCALVSAPAIGERPTILAFTTEQGLVSNSGIASIQQDGRGYLWIGTHEGLSRFDGSTFRNYGSAQGMSSPPQIFKLLVSRDDDIWASVGGGRYRPRGDSTHLFESVSLDGAPAMSYLEDRQGAIWAIGNGLYRNAAPQEGNDFVRVCLEMQTPCTKHEAVGDSMVEDRDGSLWIAAAPVGVIHRLATGAVERFGPKQGADARVLDFLRDRNGRIWAGTSRGLIRFVRNPSPARRLADWQSTPHAGFPPCAVNAVAQTRDGHLWAGTRCGLAEVAGETVRTYTVADGLTQDVIESVFEDRDGKLWLGTESAGLMRMERDGISAFGSESGLEQDVIDGTMLDRDGHIAVVANRNGQLLLRSGDQAGFHAVVAPQTAQPTDLGFQHWQVVMQDHDGLWWVPGSDSIRVFAPDDPRRGRTGRLLRMFTPRSGLPRGRIDCMLEDQHGDIWFGLYRPPHSTLVQWVRLKNSFVSWETAPGVPPDSVPLTLLQTRSGALWISYGSEGHVGRIRDGKHVLLRGPPGRGMGIFAIHEDDTGRLWTGRRNSTFYEIKEPDSDRPYLQPVAQVAAPFLRCILHDGLGRLYLGSEAGLLQYDPATGAVRHFHERDGLPSDVVQNGVRDRGGALWFGTGRGLIRFVPPQAQVKLPVRTSIAGLSLGGLELPGISDRGETELAGVRFAETAGSLRVDFSAISVDAGVRFQYRMLPGDRDWSPLSAERSVTYSRLKADTYQFAVRAVRDDGTVSEPATASFTVLLPLWKRPWFLALVALALATVGAFLYRTRVLHLLAMERLRMRIASDLHDDLGAHLTQLAVLSDRLTREDPPSGVQSGLTRIADSARSMTASLADVVWSIEPERDQIDDLFARIRRLGNDLCDAHGIEFSFRHPEEVSLTLHGDIRRNVLLIFKEALRNAIRHSECRRFTVEYRRNRGRIDLVLADDGVGFLEGGRNGGQGLLSMRRRAHAIGGDLRVESSLGAGTRIVVTFP